MQAKAHVNPATRFRIGSYLSSPAPSCLRSHERIMLRAQARETLSRWRLRGSEKNRRSGCQRICAKPLHPPRRRGPFGRNHTHGAPGLESLDQLRLARHNCLPTLSYARENGGMPWACNTLPFAGARCLANRPGPLVRLNFLLMSQSTIANFASFVICL